MKMCVKIVCCIELGVVGWLVGFFPTLKCINTIEIERIDILSWESAKHCLKRQSYTVCIAADNNLVYFYSHTGWKKFLKVTQMLLTQNGPI